jgi:hypothetical protein
MTAAYVRQTYGVAYTKGTRLVVDGRPGTLVSFPGQYLGVRFDGEKRTARCHPTWRVELEKDARTCLCGDHWTETRAADAVDTVRWAW